MELKKRSEFPENELWDLTALYQDQEDFLRAIEKTREEINEFFKRICGCYYISLRNSGFISRSSYWIS